MGVPPPNMDTLNKSFRHKAQLVAKRYFQMSGVNFSRTFAPVAKIFTSRCIFTLGAMMNWEMH